MFTQAQLPPLPLRKPRPGWLGATLAVVLGASATTCGADQPQWGEAWSRNLVSPETGLPVTFDPASGRNIRWVASLGTESYATPVVANGRVLIGTNNGEPRDPRHSGDRGVLMCFDERDGRFLWQLVVPKRSEDPYLDWPGSGICSPPTVEGNRAYVVDNRGVVLCLDLEGLLNGNDGPYQEEGRYLVPPGTPPLDPGPTDADIVWAFDLTAQAGIWSHDAAHSSVLIYGPHLYLNTGTGVDNTHRKIRTPDAPGLVVLDKSTGRLVGRDGERTAPRVFHSTWSAPSLGWVNGRPLVFFAGGNGVVYAFEPLATNTPSAQVQTLHKVWEYDFDPGAPKEDVHRFNSNRRESPSNMYGMPVFHDRRVYVAGGGDIFWGKNEAWLQCIDAAGAGDITRTGRVWTYPLERHTVSTPAVRNGLVFIADCGRMVHCVDARSGKPHWSQELKGEIWASPFIADGRVYIGSRRGDFWTFAASPEKQVLATVELGQPISGVAVAAHRTLFLATMTHLYAAALPGDTQP